MANEIRVANQILAVNPNNLNALATLTMHTYDRVKACEYAERGLRALEIAQKPAAVSDADWVKFKSERASDFNLPVGFHAVETKDYVTAQRSLEIAAEHYPRLFGVAYGLSLAYLESPDAPNCEKGLWYFARAINLGTPEDRKKHSPWCEYGRRKYKECYGSEAGWPKLLESARLPSR